VGTRESGTEQAEPGHQTNLAERFIVRIPAQIANIEYKKFTISGHAPPRFQKREEAMQDKEISQARTTNPT
jgi:hypothetical protein